MSKLNILFTLTSLNVLLVTVERFSFTTKILLQPYGFLRLHEIFQMTVLILVTVIIPFLILKEVTNNFALFKTKKGFWLALIFLIGVYFYATGNGLHEVSSFNFNHFCDTKNIVGNVCQTMFFNDYYTGNIFYFVGALLMNIPILIFEKVNPGKKLDRKNLIMLTINALVYAFAIFAYAAFDPVLVGLSYSIIMLGVSIYFYLVSRKNILKMPLTLYSLIVYLAGTIPALLLKLGR